MSESPAPAFSEQDISHPDGVVITTNSNSPEWQAGEAIEASVFMEVGYVEQPAELSEEYQKYLPVTEFVVSRQNGEVGGSIRIIHYDPELGFKTLDDINNGRLTLDEDGKSIIEGLNLNQVFEVGTLAVKKELRGKPEDEGRVSVDLYGAIYGEGRDRDCPYAIASFDEKYFNNFKSIFGDGVKALGPATDYMGSPTVPALIDIPLFMRDLKKALPNVYQAMEETANNMRRE